LFFVSGSAAEGAALVVAHADEWAVIKRMER
jgi:hypothetical protein